MDVFRCLTRRTEARGRGQAVPAVLPGAGAGAAGEVRHRRGRAHRAAAAPASETQLDHFLPVSRNRLFASSFLSLICYCPLVEIGWPVAWLPKPCFFPMSYYSGTIFLVMWCCNIVYMDFNIQLHYSVLCYAGNKDLLSLQLITNVVLCLGVEQTSLLISVLYKGNCTRCCCFRLKIIQSCRVRTLKWTLCMLPASTSLVHRVIFSRSRNTAFLLSVISIWGLCFYYKDWTI